MRCGLVETEDAMMARFLGGLNREIQDILDYKDYNSITRLFHFACKAERQVQGRQNKGRGNFSAGRSTSWTHTPVVPLVRESTPTVSNNGARSTTKSVAQVSEVSTEPAKSSYSTASTGRTRDVLCHGCGGRGHIKKRSAQTSES